VLEMLSIVVFYFLFLSIGLYLKNRRRAIGVIIIGTILTVIDYVAFCLGKHIQFMDFFRLDDDVVAMGVCLLPLNFLCITIFALGSIIISYYIFSNQISRLHVGCIIFFAFLTILYPYTVKAYLNMFISIAKFSYYATLDKETVLQKLKCADNFIGVKEGKIKAGKNLVVIYCESFEDTLFKYNNGTLVRKIGKRIKEQQLYRYTDYEMCIGSDATLNALYATQTGLPLFIRARTGMESDFTRHHINIDSYTNILNKAGYNSSFVSCSNLKFSNTDMVMTKLGYKVKGMECVADNKNSNVFGYHDAVTFEYAKKELLQLSKKEQPFNLAVLTVDTHFPYGYQDFSLKSKVDLKVDGNSIEYSYVSLDYLLDDFLNFLDSLPNAQDTVVMIIGDHLLMGNDKLTPFVGSLNKYPRRIALLTNRQINKFRYEDKIGFYDIPNIIFDLIELQTDINIGKSLFPEYSPDFIKNNKELFMVYMLKGN